VPWVGGAVTRQHGMVPVGAGAADSGSPWQHDAREDSGAMWHERAACSEADPSPTRTQWLLASRKLNRAAAVVGTRRQRMAFESRIVT